VKRPDVNVLLGNNIDFRDGEVGEIKQRVAKWHQNDWKNSTFNT